jgi:hypothetical protein
VAVAYVSDTDKTPATGTSIAYTSFAVSGTNPVIVLIIAYYDAATTTTVSGVAVSAGLTAGTPVEVVFRRCTANSGTAVSIWAIPAPSGTGTITATLSASVPWQSNAILLQGADQTTPCPTGDAASTDNAGGATNPLSVTPANLTANDAAVGGGANGNGGDAPTFNQTETFNNNTSIVNLAAGYHLGTGAVTVTWGSQDAVDTLAAVRVVASAGGTTLEPGLGSVPFTGRVPDVLVQMSNDARIVFRKA